MPGDGFQELPSSWTVRGAEQSTAPLVDALAGADLGVSSPAAAGTLAVLVDLAGQGVRVMPDLLAGLPSLPPSSSTEEAGLDAYQLPEMTGRPRSPALGSWWMPTAPSADRWPRSRSG